MFSDDVENILNDAGGESAVDVHVSGVTPWPDLYDALAEQPGYQEACHVIDTYLQTVEKHCRAGYAMGVLLAAKHVLPEKLDGPAHNVGMVYLYAADHAPLAHNNPHGIDETRLLQGFSPDMQPGEEDKVKFVARKTPEYGAVAADIGEAIDALAADHELDVDAVYNGLYTGAASMLPEEIGGDALQHAVVLSYGIHRFSMHYTEK